MCGESKETGKQNAKRIVWTCVYVIVICWCFEWIYYLLFAHTYNNASSSRSWNELINKRVNIKLILQLQCKLHIVSRLGKSSTSVWNSNKWRAAILFHYFNIQLKDTNEPRTGILLTKSVVHTKYELYNVTMCIFAHAEVDCVNSFTWYIQFGIV